MPYLINSQISRKQFLKRSLKIAGTFSFMGVSYSWSSAKTSPDGLHLGLLADTHVKAYQSEQYRGFYPYANFQEVISQINSINPEGIIINGDIARLDGQLGDYTAIQELLEEMNQDIPVAMTLGNHDDRENFYNIFGQEYEGKKDVGQKHVMVLERQNMKLILLDSLMFVNKTPGLLGSEQRDWLSAYLEETDEQPVFVFFHHTPYDGDGDLLDSDKLFKILSAYKKVKAVFYGHSHVYRISERYGLKLINLPAVGYNFSDSQPVGWIESWISPTKGTFKLHAIGGNTENNQQVTEISWN